MLAYEKSSEIIKVEYTKQVRLMRRVTNKIECEPPVMIQVPQGAFLMGSRPGDLGCQECEQPKRMVHVSAFDLGVVPVTFAQWDACIADGGTSHRPEDCGWGRDDRPVINVSWDDAQTYIAWLNYKTGKTYRLPSEAEWEYACRAGTTTGFSTGDGIDTGQANFDGRRFGKEYLGKTLPTASYPPNPWGLHDMHGNVLEWVEDTWTEAYNLAHKDAKPWVDDGIKYRVTRGGSWNLGPGFCRSAERAWVVANGRYDDLGFRLAMTRA